MTTIVLIEDAADLARLIVRELAAAGYRVRHAADDATALQLFAEETPDLVVLDWMLPGLDGIEVLRRLRQGSVGAPLRSGASVVPVLMLTDVRQPHRFADLAAILDAFSRIDTTLSLQALNRALATRAVSVGSFTTFSLASRDTSMHTSMW